MHDRATISVAFHAASFSSVGGERRRGPSGGASGGRESAESKMGLGRTMVGGRPDRKMTQWGRYVESVFSTAVPLGLFPRSQIEICIEVLDADGGMSSSHSIPCSIFFSAAMGVGSFLKSLASESQNFIEVLAKKY